MNVGQYLKFNNRTAANRLPQQRHDAPPSEARPTAPMDSFCTGALNSDSALRKMADEKPPTAMAPTQKNGRPEHNVSLQPLLLENPILPGTEPPTKTVTQSLKKATFEPTEPSSLGKVKNLSQTLANRLKELFGGGDAAYHLKQEQSEILALEAKYSAKDPVTGEFLIPDLSVKTNEFRHLLISGKANLDDIRADAYAVAREASARAVGMRHYECQVLGALAMDQGSIAEMKTGEGKTLTAVLPLYLNALAVDENGQGKGAHLITVNDTLAKRDGEEMRPVFESLGLSLGIVTEDMSVSEKQEAYECDVTYSTNTTIGFDYLRDQMVTSAENRVQRGLHYALIDEVDMVLIDEASTPLILSTDGPESEAEYRNFANLVKGMKTDGTDFLINNKDRTIQPTEEGIRYIETHLNFQEARETYLQAKAPVDAETQENYRLAENARNSLVAWRQTDDPKQAAALKQKFDQAYDQAPSYNLYATDKSYQVNLFDNALKSQFLFHKGEDYLVLDGEVKIVDQFKGRAPQGRRYSNGLHQALEAKEGVVVKEPTRTLASVTYPSLFKLYSGSPELRHQSDKARGVAGMSGTALSEAKEFSELYGLNVVPIPTNKPVILEKKDHLFFETQAQKFEAVADRAAELFRQGKPVLIGTVSVENNEKVAALLHQRGIPCQVLNAKNVKGGNGEEKEQISRESEMIAHAGRSGMVTVATNMAGRGVNIKPDWIAHSKLSADVMRRSLPLGQMASRFEQLMTENKAGVANFGSAQTATSVASYLRGEGFPVEVSENNPALLKVGTSAEFERLSLSEFQPRPAVVDVKDEKEAKKLEYWFEKTGMPVEMVDRAAPAPPAGTVQIRILPTDRSRKDPNSYIDPTPRAVVPDGVEYFSAENYFTGGLHVLATEAHDSPRIDRQLVGRAGRQGAPGQYQFFLSAEDRVPHFYGGDKMKEVFQELHQNGKPGLGIASSRLEELLTEAQRKVSARQFEQRQANHKFDQVNDPQRSLFYDLRETLVDADELSPLLESWTERHFLQELKSNLPTKWFGGWKPEDVAVAQTKVKEKLGFDLPLVFNPELPITEEIVDNAVRRLVRESFRDISDRVEDRKPDILSSADRAWSQHLETLDLLQTNVNLEVLAQQDPKRRYRERAWESFGQFHHALERDAVSKVVGPLINELS